MKTYLINVPSDSLNYWSRVYEFKTYINNFFQTGLHENFLEYDSHKKTKQYEYYQDQLGIYAKCVWLTKEYFNNKQFKYPLGLTWNTNKNLWNIHPGGHRCVVQYYFPKDTVLGLTHEPVTKYKKEFLNKKELETYFRTTIDVKKDNSILIDTNSQYESINNTIRKIKKFYKTTSISANFDLNSFGYRKSVVTDSKQKIKVRVDDTTNNIQAIRALLLLPLFDNFNDYGVQIERT